MKQAGFVFLLIMAFIGSFSIGVAVRLYYHDDPVVIRNAIGNDVFETRTWRDYSGLVHIEIYKNSVLVQVNTTKYMDEK